MKQGDYEEYWTNTGADPDRHILLSSSKDEGIIIKLESVNLGAVYENINNYN